MNKTLNDIYHSVDHHVAICTVLDVIESRLSALETQKDHMAHMFDLQNDWDISSRLISERHSSRLSALENIIACDGIDARLHQPSALEQKPAETEREWIPVGDGEIVWGAFKIKGSWRVKEMIRNALEPGDLWMPYRKGDPKPEPPVKRGA